MYAKLKPTKLKPSSVHLKCNLSRKCIGAYCTACGADTRLNSNMKCIIVRIPYVWSDLKHNVVIALRSCVCR